MLPQQLPASHHQRHQPHRIAGLGPYRHTATVLHRLSARTAVTPAAARQSKPKGGSIVLDEPDVPVHTVQDRELHEEASASYLAYAMSVIVGRALPDVRDGLKPVHRRILYAMHELGLSHDKPFKKCARVVGEVLGKYHPHGDTAVYDALVRLAQDFSMRHPLVSGHGNFGSLDDDPPAAMRYTECRLQALTSGMLLCDLDQQVVEFIPTFDGSQEEPTVLPAKLPNLLVNGSQGIAVGIATKIPPHNMLEVVEGLSALIRNPDISLAQLMTYIPAPDFPTGNIVVVGQGATDMYTTGNGHVIIRANVLIEDGSAGGRTRKTSGGVRLVITDVPYQTSKADLVEAIAKLAESKSIDGIADVRDESDRTGTRVVVEIKPGVSPESVLSALYRSTRLQVRYATNMVALVAGVPKQLNLKEFLQHFLTFRCEVIRRRSAHQMAVADRKLRQVEGYLKALQHMDDVVQVIRQADDTTSARAALMTSVRLTKEQADAVLSLPLRRLTRLEQQDLQAEQKALEKSIKHLKALLSDAGKVLELVEVEARQVAAKHGSPRRSQIQHEQDVDELSDGPAVGATPAAQLPSPMLVLGSAKGFLQKLNLSEPVSRLRAKLAASVRPGDALQHVLPVDDADQVLVITPQGTALRIKASAVPEHIKGSYGASSAQVLGAKSSVSIAGLVCLQPYGNNPGFHTRSKSSSSTSPSPGTDPDVHESGQEGKDVEGGDEGQEQQDREQDGAREVQEAGGPHLVMVTKLGHIKKVSLASLSRVSKSGSTVYKVRQGDEVQWAGVAHPGDLIVMGSSSGRVTLFRLSEIRSSGRGSGGVLGMRLRDEQHVVGGAVIPAAAAATFVRSHTAGEAVHQDEQPVLSGDTRQEQVQQSNNSVDADGSPSTATYTATDVTSESHRLSAHISRASASISTPLATNRSSSVGTSPQADAAKAQATSQDKQAVPIMTGPWLLLALSVRTVPISGLKIGSRAQAGAVVCKPRAQDSVREVDGGSAAGTLAGLCLLTSSQDQVCTHGHSSGLVCTPAGQVVTAGTLDGAAALRPPQQGTLGFAIIPSNIYI